MTAKYRLSALLLSCLPMTFIEAQAEDIPLIDDASLSGKARTVYYDIENTEKDSTSGAWTGALWLDLRSGYIEDIVGFGLSYYGVTKLNMPDNNVHSNQLLDDQNKGFGKLGQAYVELKLPSSPTGPEASFTAGRLTKRTGLLSGSTSRSLPSSWSGYNLAGAYQNVSFGLAYAEQTSLRNESDFHKITNFSGETIKHVIASEIGYSLALPNDKTLQLKYRNAFSDRFIQAHNLDTKLTVPIFNDSIASFGASYYHTQKDGDLWHGTGFGGTSLFDNHASAINLNAGLQTGHWHFKFGVSHFQAKSSQAKSKQTKNGQTKSSNGYTKPGEYYYDLGKNTHGAWDINTNGFAEDFMYDGETSWMTGASYDFADTALHGLELGYAFHYGSGMKVIDPQGKKHSVSEHEHDILAVYAFPQKVLKGLKFKMKYGLYRNDRTLRKAINKQENDLRVWLDYDFILF